MKNRESVIKTEGVPIKKLAGILRKSRIPGSPYKKLGDWWSQFFLATPFPQKVLCPLPSLQGVLHIMSNAGAELKREWPQRTIPGWGHSVDGGGHFQALGITSVQATATLQALKIVVWGKGVGNKNWRGVPIKKLGASWDPLGAEN